MDSIQETALLILVVMGGLGLFFGLVLAFADKRFAMETNPLIAEVEEVLPKGQCGACGFAGCANYAAAVVEDPEVPPNLCVPGKGAVAAKVAALTGKKAAAVKEQRAHLRCRGGESAAYAYQYRGISDCAAAKLLQGGPKRCKYGCLGFGNCVKACPFDALHLGADGLPVVDLQRCTGCGKCAEICPQQVMEMIPLTAKVSVRCHSEDFGGQVRKNCQNACLGCGLCQKSCPHGAIQIKNHLAVVDPAICAAQCTEPLCLAKCPTQAIAAELQRTDL